MDINVLFLENNTNRLIIDWIANITSIIDTWYNPKIKTLKFKLLVSKSLEKFSTKSAELLIFYKTAKVSYKIILKDTFSCKSRFYSKKKLTKANIISDIKEMNFI